MVICPDSKLIEPKDSSSITTKGIVRDIMDRHPASANLEAALQRVLFLITVLPSIRLGLIVPASLALSGDGTAVISHASPYGRAKSSDGSPDDVTFNKNGHPFCIRATKCALGATLLLRMLINTAAP